MLVSRTYRNNTGYQIDVSRPHPIVMRQIKRHNYNNYYYDGYNVSMSYNRGREKGLQYGGKKDCIGCEDKCVCDTNDYQKGQGIDPASIYSALKTIYSGIKTASDIYASEPATVIKNTYGKFMNKNYPNWRSGFAGEKHLINKAGLTYNFCGPNTNLSARLERGDPPLDADGLDLACKIHDIDYNDAKNWSDVRKADEKFMDNVDKATISNTSKKVIKGLFKGKMLAEDVGLIKKTHFTNFPNIQEEIPEKIQEQQPSRDIMGQGIKLNKNMDPARKLKNKIKKYRLKNKSDKLMNIAIESIKKRLKK